MAHAGKHLWALDFDGVICDSVGESALTAWKAAAKVFPDLIDSSANRQDEIVEKMHKVRPVVETGYENVIQVRALLEGSSTDDILAHWDTILPEKMQQWQLDRDEMVKLFGETRDEWMQEDMEGWLAPNRIYDGVADALQAVMDSDSAEVYIVTTKQARFTQAILKQKADVDFPLDRIHSNTESGTPKSDIIIELRKQHQECTTSHFVEDKLSTLRKGIKVSELDDLKLYFVDWGYNTEAERQEAAESDKMELIDVTRFGELLR